MINCVTVTLPVCRRKCWRVLRLPLFRSCQWTLPQCAVPGCSSKEYSESHQCLKALDLKPFLTGTSHCSKKRDEPNQRLTNFESKNYHRLFHVNRYILPLFWMIMHLSHIPFLLSLFWPPLPSFSCNMYTTITSSLTLATLWITFLACEDRLLPW